MKVSHTKVLLGYIIAMVTQQRKREISQHVFILSAAVFFSLTTLALQPTDIFK